MRVGNLLTGKLLQGLGIGAATAAQKCQGRAGTNSSNVDHSKQYRIPTSVVTSVGYWSICYG